MAATVGTGNIIGVATAIKVGDPGALLRRALFWVLFGVRFIWFYGVVFVAMVLLGGFIELDMVWIIADIVNALMALPNLIALLALSPVVIAETKKYFGK